MNPMSSLLKIHSSSLPEGSIWIHIKYSYFPALYSFPASKKKSQLYLENDARQNYLLPQRDLESQVTHTILSFFLFFIQDRSALVYIWFWPPFVGFFLLCFNFNVNLVLDHQGIGVIIGRKRSYKNIFSSSCIRYLALTISAFPSDWLLRFWKYTSV